MSHHRCFTTHGSRLNAVWTFPVPLMEAMLRFMEHRPMVKKFQFSRFLTFGFIYKFVLPQTLWLFLLLYEVAHKKGNRNYMSFVTFPLPFLCATLYL